MAPSPSSRIMPAHSTTFGTTNTRSLYAALPLPCHLVSPLVRPGVGVYHLSQNQITMNLQGWSPPQELIAYNHQCRHPEDNLLRGEEKYLNNSS